MIRYYLAIADRMQPVLGVVIDLLKAPAGILDIAVRSADGASDREPLNTHLQISLRTIVLNLQHELSPSKRSHYLPHRFDLLNLTLIVPVLDFWQPWIRLSVITLQ